MSRLLENLAASQPLPKYRKALVLNYTFLLSFCISALKTVAKKQQTLPYLSEEKMGATSITSCCSSWTSRQLVIPCYHPMTLDCSSEKFSRRKTTSVSRENGSADEFLTRRQSMLYGVSLISSTILGFPGEGAAAVKQGLLAGRVPGLSEPDERGWRTYRRPDEKSGGHGVGWSPIIPYLFSVPQDWEEVPVSIADLGGTEIDLRFASSKEGRLFVIVAPVLRFADNLGDDAKIELIGTPEKVINAFGPEVIGENVEGKVMNMEVSEHSGRKYYQFELEPPHVLITATAAGNRLYLFNVTASGLQWKRHYKDLKKIADSFRVA